MQKFFIRIFFLFIIVGSLFFFFYKQKVSVQQKISPTPTHTPETVSDGPKQTMLFVPYWTFGSKDTLQNYPTLIYFGITANEKGINTTEDGYKNIEKFRKLASKNQKTLLTMRFINNDINQQILQNKTLQQTISNDTIALAKKYEFDGIVFDFETNALAFDDVIKNISDFNANFYALAQKNNLSYFSTIYGDVFYRARPFDVASFAKNSDGILVMAYDFHKAKGDPGPNFPLKSITDDYDFHIMIADFLNVVPLEKLTIIFGLYGYDWKVNEKGQSFGQATPSSYNDLKKKFPENCLFKNCQSIRDVVSGETKVIYIDSENINHEVWFEDMQSVKKKTEFLHTKGIFSTAFWANGYF